MNQERQDNTGTNYHNRFTLQYSQYVYQTNEEATTKTSLWRNKQVCMHRLKAIFENLQIILIL